MSLWFFTCTRYGLQMIWAFQSDHKRRWAIEEFGKTLSRCQPQCKWQHMVSSKSCMNAVLPVWESLQLWRPFFFFWGNKTIYIRTQFVTTYLSTYKNPHYTLEIVNFDHIPSPWIELEDSPSWPTCDLKWPHMSLAQEGKSSISNLNLTSLKFPIGSWLLSLLQYYYNYQIDCSCGVLFNTKLAS